MERGGDFITKIGGFRLDPSQHCPIPCRGFHCMCPSPSRSSRKGTQYLVKWRDLSYYMATWEYLGDDCGLKNAQQAIKDYEDLRRLMDPKKEKKKRGRKPKVVLEVCSGWSW